MKSFLTYFFALAGFSAALAGEMPTRKMDYEKLMRQDGFGHLPVSQPVMFRAGSTGRYPWKNRIVTTTFWIGENPTRNNPTPNRASSWDKYWAQNYGGYDDPSPTARRNYIPVRFVPRQNPFYVALPYNDITRNGTKPEVSRVVPWFSKTFQRSGKTILKGRWVAIRKGSRVCYAQWEDCGPFRTDHWEYVFGNERPRHNLNQGAGLDVSPAVRDYLGMAGTDVTDWKFVEFNEVPRGPWALYGDNNTFVQNRSRFSSTVVRGAFAASAVSVFME